jgi:hypothetical protein
VSKRGVIILVLVVLFGVYFFVVGYEFLEKENALFQKKVKTAREEQRRCEARLSKYRNFDQFRTSIRVPYSSDLPLDRWEQKYDTVRAGMSESEVEIIMGAPDFVACDVNDKRDKFLGSIWQYEVIIPQDAMNDGLNSVLRVWFGPEGRVIDKLALNMQPKPGPSPSVTATPAVSQTATPAASPATPAAQASPAASPEGSATPAATASPTPQ